MNSTANSKSSSAGIEHPPASNCALPVICRGLRKRFGDRDAICDVDLTIPSGAKVGLIGTNGAGKSTLIKCMLGLLKPTAGQTEVFGEDSWFLSAGAKLRLGYVPQTVHLPPWMRVGQLVEYTSAFYEHWDREWAELLLDRFDLPGDRRVGPLSAGQHQKLALVLALGHRPELLILDEPVASLDPIARRELLKSLMEFAFDEKHTVLFSSHITSDLERIATHVAMLKEGRISLFDELDNIKDRVKRLRLTSSRKLPIVLPVRSALSTLVEGSQALITVADFDETLLNDLRDQYDAEIRVENLSLEDIFVELQKVKN